MGDCLKLSKDKRHRSSSSLAGVVLEGTRSERKLDIRASIPEVDDQFALAEARCDDLQEKIDLVKGLKRKRKLKKRSMTRLTEQPPVENVPFITVRTQPKKKVSMQAARLRRLEVPQNPTRCYLDPATVEQHRMIGQVRGYSQMYKQPQTQEKTKTKQSYSDLTPQFRTRQRRAHADGDNMQAVRTGHTASLEVACGQDEAIVNDSDNEVFDQRQDYVGTITVNKKPVDLRLQSKQPSGNRRKPVSKGATQKEGTATKWQEDSTEDMRGTRRVITQPAQRRHQANNRQLISSGSAAAATTSKVDERPVVELFSKNRSINSADVRQRAPLHHTVSTEKNISHVCADNQRSEDQGTVTVEDETPAEFRKEKDVHRHPRRVKYRSRRYELPTVASQMKQAGVRYYYNSVNHTNIPFIVSKSTAPSHNIGVNIQQVLNGLKIQQPLSGIPFTIAHHMGLGHVPYYNAKAAPVQPSLDHHEMNAIRLGRRLLRLPSYKYMSYNRLLNLYREGDGMVSRFLRAISRPHYFYTSMYNLATRDDFDGATSKGRGASQEAKQSLAEYASLYREYEQVDKCIKEGNYEPELERRKDELTRELAAREDHIRKVVQEYRASGETDQTTLRASLSTADDSYRHSAFKLNLGDAHQL